MKELMDDITVKRDTADVDWKDVAALLEKVGMAVHAPEKHKRAFDNSEIVVFVFNDEKLIGMGRGISDGEYEAALYDLAIEPEYQGSGLGRLIVETLMSEIDGQNAIFFAAPGTEEFYHKLGFADMKTGMVRFSNEETMRGLGFID